MSESCRLRRGEGYAACTGEVAFTAVLAFNGVSGEPPGYEWDVESVHFITFSYGVISPIAHSASMKASWASLNRISSSGSAPEITISMP